MSVPGQLTPQFHVAHDARPGLLDDLLGRSGRPGFTLLGFGVDPAAALDDTELAVLDGADVSCVMLLEQDYPISEVARSARTQRLVLLDDRARAWFTGHDIEVVLVRPDFYAHSSATRASDAGALLRRLQADLTPGAPAPTPRSPVPVPPSAAPNAPAPYAPAG